VPSHTKIGFGIETVRRAMDLPRVVAMKFESN